MPINSTTLHYGNILMNRIEKLSYYYIYIYIYIYIYFNLYPTGSLKKKRSLLHLLSLAHKSIYYTSPPYLTSLLTLRRPLTSLRSNADISQICPRVSYLKYHKCAFSYMVPSLWNSLPASIRSIHSHPSFITHLKAYISSM